MKIALVVYKTNELSGEDNDLQAYLASKGHRVDQVIWHDETINWQYYELVILKSPWDYHNNIHGFHAWLDKLGALNCKVLNPIDILKWNSDKHYLEAIAGAGLPVIPTAFLEKGETPDLPALFKQFNTTQLIIKPCVSASAQNTIRVAVGDPIEILPKEESYMVQPFMNEIYDGEWSMLFFGGRYSHSELKLPQPNDFRVQHYYGGTSSPAVPYEKHIKSAEKYVSRFAAGTLYARVDGLVCDGQFMLMELELIEPYLYLNSSPAAFENYYRGLLALAAV